MRGGGPGTAVVCIDPETSTAGGRADQRRRRRQRDRPPVGAGVTLPPAAAAVLRLAGACAQPAAAAEGELGPARRQQVSGRDGAGPTGRAGGCAAAAWVPERDGGRGGRREP